MEVHISDGANVDLEQLPVLVGETFFNKLEDIRTALDLGASPAMAFEKYLSGPMHPLLQMKLGRDHRAWFIEGKHVPCLEDDTVLCLAILSKKDAQEAARRGDVTTLVRDAL